MVDMRETYDNVGGSWLNEKGWYRGTIVKVHRRQAQTQKDLQEILEVTFKCNDGPKRALEQKGTWWLTEKAAWRVVMLFKYAGLKKNELPAGDVNVAEVDYRPLVGHELMFYVDVEERNEKFYGDVTQIDLLTPVSAGKAETSETSEESEEKAEVEEERNPDLPDDDSEDPPF